MNMEARKAMLSAILVLQLAVCAMGKDEIIHMQDFFS